MTDRIDALRALENELSDAVKAHSRDYPDGDWKDANNRIGVARLAIDNMLPLRNRTLGIKGNAETLDIIRAPIAQEGGE